MTDAGPSAVIKTTQHEEASRLPDTSWLWRRLLLFMICIVCLYIGWRISERATDVGTLRQINRYTWGIIALSLLLYCVGATVTDVAKLVTAFLSTKKTTETHAPPPSSVTTDGHGRTRIEAGGDDRRDRGRDDDCLDEGELPLDQRIG